MEKLNDLSYKIIGWAYKVHSELGPGLLESSYETCLQYELANSGIYAEGQKELPLIYQKVHLNAGYRIDLLVEEKIIIEIKSIDAIAPIHKAQLITYMKLSDCKLGLLINFNSVHLKEGIHRFIL